MGIKLSAIVDENTARAFKALGDPTRLAIFSFIRACGSQLGIDEESGDCHEVSETCVGDICCTFDVAPSTVSHHLKELRNAGLINLEKRGRWVYVRVNEPELAALAGFLREASGTPIGKTQDNER